MIKTDPLNASKLGKNRQNRFLLLGRKQILTVMHSVVQPIAPEMVDKWSIKTSLAEKLVDILEFVVDKDEFTTEQIVSNFDFNATTETRWIWHYSSSSSIRQILCVSLRASRQRGKYLSMRAWKRALWLGSKRWHNS